MKRGEVMGFSDEKRSPRGRRVFWCAVVALGVATVAGSAAAQTKNTQTSASQPLQDTAGAAVPNTKGYTFTGKDGAISKAAFQKDMKIDVEGVAIQTSANNVPITFEDTHGFWDVDADLTFLAQAGIGQNDTLSFRGTMQHLKQPTGGGPGDRTGVLSFSSSAADGDRQVKTSSVVKHGNVIDEYAVNYIQTAPTGPPNDITTWNLTITGNHLSDFKREPSRWSKIKEISITEEIVKTQSVNIEVVARLEPSSVTEAAVFGTAFNIENSYGPETGAIGPVNGPRNSTIGDSLNGLSGLASLNQDTGSFSNQGFIAAFGEPGTAEPGAVGFSESQTEMETGNFDNRVSPAGIGIVEAGDGGEDEVVVDAPDEIDVEIVPMTLSGTGPATAAIGGSANGATGVLSLNNNAGILNNQISALSMAVGFAPGKAVAHADLAQENSGNTDLGSNDPRTASITGSLNGSQGIMLVNNASGHLGNQGSVISFAGSASASF